MSGKLAINGGNKIRTELFPDQSTIGPEEMHAVHEVLNSGLLTGYKGNAGDGFYGGPEIQALEKEWADVFSNEHKYLNDDPKTEYIEPKKLHCIPINSCTSGLFVACGAAGIKPGDEVIVTPYSMTCSATAPMIWGGVPVFADIDPLTFNLDPDDVERKITSRTKAIIVVDLFGLPYDKRIDEIAKKHNLIVIEDAAQAVGATRRGKYAGTLGHIGVFSFNQGKHLTSGEGGMICTYGDRLAERCRLLMNHGEAVINDRFNSDCFSSIAPDYNHINLNDAIYGFNLRMTEIQAAMVRVQLRKFDDLLSKRLNNVSDLLYFLNELPGLKIHNMVRPDGYRHSYYALPLLFDQEVWGVHRDIVVNAVKAELMPCAGRADEGVTISNGYIKPIWRMPVFSDLHVKHLDLEVSLTPICDKLWKDDLILLHRFFGPNAEPGDMGQVADAFKKVWDNKEELK